jgi:hypothetical protein
MPIYFSHKPMNPKNERKRKKEKNEGKKKRQ